MIMKNNRSLFTSVDCPKCGSLCILVTSDKKDAYSCGCNVIKKQEKDYSVRWLFGAMVAFWVGFAILALY